ELADAQERAAAVVVADTVAAVRLRVEVAEADVRRVGDTYRGGIRRMAAGDAILLVVGDRDVLRPVDLDPDGFRARRRFFFGLRRVEVPVLDAIELDLVEQVMLGRQLVDVSRRRGVRDVEP